MILPPPPDWLAARVAAALGEDAAGITLRPVSGDAGSRQYYRVQRGDAGTDAATLIAVTDSDPAQQECFLRVRALFASAGVRVPQVHTAAKDFLLLEDFGDATFQKILSNKTAPPEQLYTAAISALVHLQQSRPLAAALPPYNAARLQAEMRLFEDWYCRVHLTRPLSPAALRTLQQAKNHLAEVMSTATPVAIHRDYHCRNLLWLGRESDTSDASDTSGKVGMVDFQDAVSGDALYDVVSLLRDAYEEWSAQQQAAWLQQYWQAARQASVPVPPTLPETDARLNIAGAQRGLKVLGIFARLHHRDNKSQYLADLPRVHRHLQTACAALVHDPATAPLQQLIQDHPPQ